MDQSVVVLQTVEVRNDQSLCDRQLDRRRSGSVFGVFLMFLIWVFGGGWDVIGPIVEMASTMILAGGLLVWSGVCLFRSQRVPGKAVALVGSTVALASIFCTVLFVMLSPSPRFWQDEEILTFLFIPMGVVLVIAGEFVFLLREWKQGGQ